MSNMTLADQSEASEQIGVLFPTENDKMKLIPILHAGAKEKFLNGGK